jgi:hypothetical protein
MYRGNSKIHGVTGAGSGFVGVMCAKIGANVVITDYQQSALDLINKNLQLNNLSAQIMKLNWHKLDEFSQENSNPSFDLVFGSDVLYQSRNAESITELLAGNLLREGGAGVIFCPGRGYAERLERLCNQNSQGLNARAFFLENLTLPNCKMAELHIVEVRKGGETGPRVSQVLHELSLFIEQAHSV